MSTNPGLDPPLLSAERISTLCSPVLNWKYPTRNKFTFTSCSPAAMSNIRMDDDRQNQLGRSSQKQSYISPRGVNTYNRDLLKNIRFHAGLQTLSHLLQSLIANAIKERSQSYSLFIFIIHAQFLLL